MKKRPGPEAGLWKVAVQDSGTTAIQKLGNIALTPQIANHAGPGGSLAVRSMILMPLYIVYYVFIIYVVSMIIILVINSVY
jgi:hypothetical protein